MRDGFLASMVAQYKRNQSRASAPSTGNLSRPSSALSQISSNYDLPPVRTISQELNSSREQSCSERSTPATFSTLVAKCQSCNLRADLTVCAHCDKVICAKCRVEHQNVINSDVKQEWNRCKENFERFSERSSKNSRRKNVDGRSFFLDHFDTNHEECEGKGRQLQNMINRQAEQLLQTINQSKNIYLDLIEKHRRTSKSL